MDRAAADLPRIELGASGEARLVGDWTHRALSGRAAALRAQLAQVPPGAAWDLEGIGLVDSFGALLVWRAWGRRWPEGARVPPVARQALERLEAAQGERLPRRPAADPIAFVANLGVVTLGLAAHMRPPRRALPHCFLPPRSTRTTSSRVSKRSSVRRWPS